MSGDDPIGSRLTVLAEHLPFDVWVRDADQRCVYANPACEEHFPGLVGRTPDDTDAAAEAIAIWKANNARAYAGEIVVGDVEYGTGDEPRRVVRNYIAPVRADDGRIVGTVGVNVDITAQRSAERVAEERQALVTAMFDAMHQLESQLLRSEHLASLGTLAASVAHEIKNPATAIQLCHQMLRRELAASRSLDEAERARLLETVDDAEEGARRVTRLVTDLSRLARPARDDHERVDLDEVVRCTVGLARAKIALHAQLVVELGAPASVLASAPQLAQVVMNLAFNAAEALGRAGRRGRITIRTSQNEGRSCLEVEDDGPGVPAELRPRLFTPFATGSASGTGLGLFVCRQIVQDFGGTIEEQPRAGGGTRMRVELPSIPELGPSVTTMSA